MFRSFPTTFVPLVLMGLACASARSDPAPATSPSRIVGVTVYHTSAMVTREVTAPEAAGLAELVVGPLPPSVVSNSLYSEGGEGARVLTTRYRTRIVQENIQEEVRRLEAQVKDLARESEAIRRQMAAIEQNSGLLGKLEGFTAGSLQHMTEKGMLNADAVTKISDFIMNTRLARSAEVTELTQKLRAIEEKTGFLHREMSKVAGASDKTIREAVIVVEKPAGPAKVNLNYIVGAASWRPQYKLRATRGKPDVQMEYLAAVHQQSGEDWRDAEVVLSTAQPRLNAAPPELAKLSVSIGGGASAASSYLRGRDELLKQSEQLRSQGQSAANLKDERQARTKYNEAADIDQAWEILNPATLQARTVQPPTGAREGQSVTFRLPNRLSIPWRDDEQLLEIARLPLKADYFYKALPVLTAHVYRLGVIVNDSKLVVLPGEATMYQDTDFVGVANLPLVAIGEQFTAGFGVDPQLQVQRDLVEKGKAVQGGNHVLKFDYRILISSYKTEPVRMELWDRLPHSDSDAVSVTLIGSGPELSKDAGYVRDGRPKNLLRWDLTIPPQTKGDKATTVTYQYKLEMDRNVAVTPPPKAGKTGQPSPSSPPDAIYDLQLKSQ